MQKMKNFRRILQPLSDFLFSSKTRASLLVFVIVGSIAATTAISMVLTNHGNLTVSSVGSLKTVGVEAYWDHGCKTKVVRIDWGEIYPGSSSSVTLYIKNISNIETTLYLTMSNLMPSAISNYVTLYWDYSGMRLTPGQVIGVTLFLSVSGDNSLISYLTSFSDTSFTLDIQIAVHE
jgi:hypothetical protein